MTAHQSGRVVIAPSILATDFGRLREAADPVTGAAPHPRRAPAISLRPGGAADEQPANPGETG
jgi:hypothetical protein